jgi:hypothetical protein
MEVRGVDPRDIEAESRAVYRVFFWSAGRALSHEYELAGATDVHEVLGWIDANAEGREVEAMIVVDGAAGKEAVYFIGPLDHGSGRGA